MLTIHNKEYELKNIDENQLKNWKTDCLNAFPTHKKYQTIYCDPPWSFGSAGSSVQNQATNHYPTESIEKMSKIPVWEVADRDCALFIWVCNPLLPQALELIKNWGFEYKTVFKVWRKTYPNGNNVCVPGWWSRGSTELLLVATKGSPLKNKTTNSEPQEFTSVREGHSVKPDEIRDSVYHFLNVKNRLEMFGRKTVSNWDCWGLECPSFFNEADCISNTEIIDKFRTIGIQCDIGIESQIKSKQKAAKKKSGNSNGGNSNHKPDCGCCVCKNVRLKSQKERELNDS